MKNYLLAILSIAVLGLSSCKEETGEGTLTMKYDATVNNTPLVLNQNYDMDGETVRFELIEFYVSDVHIHDKDGANMIEVKDVALIDFRDESTTSFSITLEEGAYKNPMYTFGLSDELNMSDPSTFDSGHPLSLGTSMYWLMSTAYIYFKIEGFRTVGGVEEPFVYHVGHPVSGTGKMAQKALTIHKDNTTTVLNTFNLNDVFANIDFSTESETHTMNNMPLANKMMVNFSDAISIN